MLRAAMYVTILSVAGGAPAAAQNANSHGEKLFADRGDGRVESISEGDLEAVAKAHPALSLGSYPFFGPEGFGSNLVVRGRDEGEVAATVEELIGALAGVGAKTITRVEA